MPDPRKIYIGYDPIDHKAYQVAETSLRNHASVPVYVLPLKDWELRKKGIFWRPHFVEGCGQKYDGRDGKPFSTAFSFTRFVIPILEKYDSGWVLFTDPDVLWRADIAELWDSFDESKAVMCVQHNHNPSEHIKGMGVQTRYHRKNWSSVMAFNCYRNKDLTKYALNNMSGSWLHAMNWLKDEEIGELPEKWNFLVGYSDPEIDAKIAHFTLGTPDMEGYEDSQYADEWWNVYRNRNVTLLSELL